MHVLLRTLLLGAIAMTLTPVRALAQPAPAPAPAPAAGSPIDKTKTAKQYVDAGLAAQKSGDYDTALIFYSKAYALVPHPLLLFDMAQAHRLAGRVEQALELYARYLAADPSGSEAQTARDLVAEIDARKAEEARKAEDARKAQEARKAEDAHMAEQARKAEQDRQAHDREAGAVPTTPADAAQPASTTEPAPGRTLRLSGIAAGGAGVVGLALGIGFGLHARTLSNELSRPGAMYDPAKVDSGNRANTIAVTGFIGGTVLVAAGATLYWWGHMQDRRAEGVALAPMVSGQMAGLVMVGTLP